MHSIRLLKQGLLCSTVEGENQINKTAFFPYDQLDAKKVREIQKLISENDFLNKKSFVPPDSVIIPSHSRIWLTFEALDESIYNYFFYEVCEPEVDSLIKMSNGLVPKDNSSMFSIRLKCD